MKVELTTKEYVHLRLIIDYEGDCSRGAMLNCDKCPLGFGYNKYKEMPPSLTQSEEVKRIYTCIDQQLRKKYASEILAMDVTIKGLLVEDKI